MIELISVLTSSFIFLVLILCWIKKSYLSPIFYVMFGHFMWMHVSQLFYVFNDGFVGQMPTWEQTFEREIILWGVILNFLYIVLFSLGYIAVDLVQYGRQKKLWYESAYDYTSPNVFRISLITFILGITFVFTQYSEVFALPNFVALTLSNLAVPGVILLGFVVWDNNSTRFRRLVSLFCVLIFTTISNTKILFSLLPFILYGFLGLNKRRPVISRLKIFGLVIFFPILLIFQMAVKVWQRVDETYLSAAFSMDRLLGPDLRNEVEKRLFELDSFNIENFPFFLHTIKRFILTGEYFYGQSFQVFLPFLKIFFEDIRGLGRIIVLNLRGPEWESVNWSMGVPFHMEFYLNFGAVALPLFFLYGFCCAILFRMYLKSKSSTSPIYYGFFLVVVFMQQRGDLLFSTVYSCFALIIMFTILKFTKKY